jgi:hypothetical protein
MTLPWRVVSTVHLPTLLPIQPQPRTDIAIGECNRNVEAARIELLGLLANGVDNRMHRWIGLVIASTGLVDVANVGGQDITDHEDMVEVLYQ